MPAPVETVLSRHPSVADCAVFGLEDDRLGERVVAAVVLVTGAIEPTLDDIREYLSQSLDSTATPRELHIVDELPRRGIGKLDRRALRERFANGGDLPGGYGW
jgi:O-succinylbenzoic acid--CoA ligase